MMATLTLDQQERLLSLQGEDGRLTPDIVLADAKNPDSPLHTHPAFEWDLAKAAHRDWLNAARHIISVWYSYSVKTTLVEAPLFVRDPSVPGNSQGYINVDKLRRNKALARQSLMIEFKRIEGALQRARVIAEVLGLEDELEVMLLQLVGLRAKVIDDGQAHDAPQAAG